MSQNLGHRIIKWTGPMAVLLFSWLLLSSNLYAIANGYVSSDSGLQTGMSVSVSSERSSEAKVERATQENSDKFVGIVTTIDASLISVGSGESTVFVENEGQVDAYVSDINGVVKEGDLLTLSPLKGILMRFSSGNIVVGTATGNVEDTSSYSYEVNGKLQDTQIAKIKVNLNIKGAQGGSAQNNSTLAKLGRYLVGREVSEIRVLMALILFVIVLIAEGSIIYGAVASAITALGRNPLAKSAIRGELVRVTVIAGMVLLVGLGAVYAVLWT